MNDALLQDIDWLPTHHVRQSARAKRISLSVSAKKGLEIILPARYNKAVLINFLQEKKSWILSHEELLNRAAKPLVCPANIYLAALDEDWDILCLPVFSRKTIKVKESGEHLLLQGPTADVKACHLAVRAWLIKKARYYFPICLQRIAEETGLGYQKLSIRGQSSIWGSCSASNDISLNYKLLFVDFSLLRYVLVHELCHTVHHNHSKAFWRLVEKHEPNYVALKRQLRLQESKLPSWVV